MTKPTTHDLLDMLQERSTNAMLSGCILVHCHLGETEQDMTRSAGAWEVSINVYELEELLALARKAVDKPTKRRGVPKEKQT